VTATNTTGSNATICAWLDLNGNGYFDPAEGITPINVPSAAGVQSFWLTWTGVSSTLTIATYTYLRIRITSASYGMNQNNSTGYYNRGEVEDYAVFVDDFPLAVLLSSFDANVTDESDVKLRWSATEQGDFMGYDVQRSANGRDWESIAFVSRNAAEGLNHYEMKDNDPYKGVSSYRLKLVSSGTQVKYSNIRSVVITDLSESIRIFPNPSSGHATVAIKGDVEGEEAHIRVIDMAGKVLSYQKMILVAGANSMNIPVHDSWPSGTYIVQVSSDRKVLTKNLVLRRQ
jgi:hypothetical protein